LYNVNDRIRLTYGESYGIAVYSDGASGTVVTISHPIIRAED
jgi:sensor histidine kinase YesM